MIRAGEPPALRYRAGPPNLWLGLLRVRGSLCVMNSPTRLLIPSASAVGPVNRRNFLGRLVVAGAGFSILGCRTTGPRKTADGWLVLFNSRNLDGWIPKIRHHAAGENYGETFRVVDGLLTVAYDPAAYPAYEERFGHLFYEQSFSHYRLRAEYRFIGQQVAGGPGWAIRNSGLMLHGQTPESMTVDQDFPASIEAQLLGGDGTNPRTTMNLCTPGTNVVMDGKLYTPHCIDAKSKTYHGEQWVMAEAEVRGNEFIRHFVNGEEVLYYEQPQLDERDASAKRLLAAGQPKMISGGTISLQSESHPVQFRRVELLPRDA